jgi:hypothetical protein
MIDKKAHCLMDCLGKYLRGQSIPRPIHLLLQTQILPKIQSQLYSTLYGFVSFVLRGDEVLCFFSILRSKQTHFFW